MVRENELGATMEENEQALRQLFSQQRGSIFREVPVPGLGGRQTARVLLVFFEAQPDQERLEAFVIRPLLEGEIRLDQLPQWLPLNVVKMKDLGEAVAYLYRGKVLLLWEGSADIYAIEIADPPHRPITPPDTESGVSGPRESFTEMLVLNLAMIRRRYPGPEFRAETIWIGSRAKLELAMVYLDGVPPKRILEEVKKRLKKVTQDGVQDVMELTESLVDHKFTVFPTVNVTERPDMVAQYILSGRIAILLDNSPRALVVPALFMDFFTSADDFYEWRPFVAFLRLLRFSAFNIAVPLPAIYVSVTTYHVQALPTQLTLSLLAQREGAPLPPPVEAAVMTLMFEILREAGIRLPRAIGPTVSIVGGLVIGDAAIRSGLTSPAMVLVVSATAVATFSLPSPTMANAATYYRFLILALATGFGFFGLLIGYLIALANVASLTSIGIPYMTPAFPLQFKYLRALFGLRARPPKGMGTQVGPGLIQNANDYEERGK